MNTKYMRENNAVYKRPILEPQIRELNMTEWKENLNTKQKRAGVGHSNRRQSRLQSIKLTKDKGGCFILINWLHQFRDVNCEYLCTRPLKIYEAKPHSMERNMDRFPTVAGYFHLTLSSEYSSGYQGRNRRCREPARAQSPLQSTDPGTALAWSLVHTALSGLTICYSAD